MSLQNLIFQAQGIIVALVSDDHLIRPTARLPHLQLSLSIIDIATSEVRLPIIVAILFLLLRKLVSLLISLTPTITPCSSGGSSLLPVAIAFDFRGEVGGSYLVVSRMVARVKVHVGIVGKRIKSHRVV